MRILDGKDRLLHGSYRGAQPAQIPQVTQDLVLVVDRVTLVVEVGRQPPLASAPIAPLPPGRRIGLLRARCLVSHQVSFEPFFHLCLDLHVGVEVRVEVDELRTILLDGLELLLSSTSAPPFITTPEGSIALFNGFQPQLFAPKPHRVGPIVTSTSRLSIW